MNETTSKAVSLKWLLCRALRAWKPITVGGLLIGLLLGFGSMGLKFLKTLDEEAMQEAHLDFDREHTSWAATGENLRAKLDNLDREKTRQLEYNEKSVLMDIDPLRKNVASFELYVDYDYVIDPNLTYQTPDLSNRILKSYETYMTGGEMYHYIMDNLDYDMEQRYLNEILSVSIDYSNNMITVSVIHTDAAKCQEILSLAQTGIQSRFQSVCDNIADHKITSTNQTAYETIDLSLEDKQKRNVQYITEIDMEIQTVNELLREWNLTSEPEFEYDTMEIIKNGIKLGLIAGVIAVALMAVLVAVMAAFTDRLRNPEDMKTRFGIRVIGLLPGNDPKKAARGLSAVFAKLAGIKIKQSEHDALARMIGASIASEIDAQKADQAWRTVAFTGTASAEMMEKAVAAMGLSTYTAVCAPDMLTDSESVDKVAAADCVVLVETQERSGKADIEKELEALAAWKKPVLGAVILGADALK